MKNDAEIAQEKVQSSISKVKTLEEEIFLKNEEIQSLKRKNQLFEQEIDKLESIVTQNKLDLNDSNIIKSSNDSFIKKNHLLEKDLEDSEIRFKEASFKLRDIDLKSEQLEKQIISLETQRDNWEKKFEELTEKYVSTKSELDEISQQLDNI